MGAQALRVFISFLLLLYVNVILGFMCFIWHGLVGYLWRVAMLKDFPEN